jgi:hypothetical protein
VRRSAQDDGFVGGLEYNWLNMQKTRKDQKVTGEALTDPKKLRKRLSNVLITSSYKFLQGRPVGITFAVKLG